MYFVTPAPQRLARLLLVVAFLGLAPSHAIAQNAPGLNAPGQNAPGQNAPGQNTPAPGPTSLRVRAYPVAPGQLVEITNRLQQQYRGLPQVRIQANPRTSQILVTAPDEVHTQIASRFAHPQAAAPSASYGLRHISGEHLRNNLRRIWPEGIQFSPGEDGATQVLAVSPNGGGSRRILSVNDQTRVVQAFGDEAEKKAWLQIVQAIDQRTTPGTDWVNFVPTRNADPRRIHRAVFALNESGPAAGDVQNVSVVRSVHDVLPLIFGQLPQAGQPAGGQAPAAGQPAPAAQPGQNPDTPPPPDQLDDKVTELGGVLGSVQIEYIEGLRGFVLRGRKQDVERVTRLIADIERLSRETQPNVEVYYLKHANSEAVGELINQVYEQILLPRQGAVSVTPLVKPNALLLIGTAENLEIVKETIEKIDTAVPYPMQFEVFELRYMAAADATEAITAAFEEPTGLSTRVRVTSFYQTNAIIVQASARDMLEVRRLLKKLDKTEIASTIEVRIFRLYNAVAEDLAPIIQDAINWQLTSSGAPLGSTGTGAGAGAGGAQERARLRSTMIEMMAIDGETNKLIKSGILSNVRITADGAGNALVVTAPSESMELIGTLIRELDNLPTASAQVKVFTILNGDATRLATMLQGLFGQTGAQQQGGFGGGAQQGGLRQLGLQTGAGAGESSLAPLSFGVDERSNSIIVSGSPGDLTVIQAILLRLDEGDLGKRKTVVYRLSNAPAQFVADSITTLLTNQRTILSQRIQQFGLQSAFEQVDSEVFVVAEQVSNSIIISATPRYYDQIMQVVADLDRRPPVIKIDILIAEIALSDNEELGVELGLQDSLLFDRSVATVDPVSMATVLSPGFLFNNNQLGNSDSAASLATRETLGGQGLTSFDVGRRSSTQNYGGLVLSAANESVNILIRALQDSGRVQLLSRPQISTLDSQPASILVGQRVPRITDSQATNQGTINSIVLDEVGLVLGVTPRVTADNIVVMEIDVEQSVVGPLIEGIPISINSNGDVIRSPRYDVRNASTTISARNGQTIAFAGLIQTERQISERKVPYLGDIPILGHLFRFDTHSEGRKELLIIMTPHIVTTQQDVDWVNYSETERMSWCLADVMELSQNAALFGSEGAFGNEDSPVIFPDEDPIGAGSNSAGQQQEPRLMPPGPVKAAPPFPTPTSQEASNRRTARQPVKSAFWQPPAPVPPAQRNTPFTPAQNRPPAGGPTMTPQPAQYEQAQYEQAQYQQAQYQPATYERQMAPASPLQTIPEVPLGQPARNSAWNSNPSSLR